MRKAFIYRLYPNKNQATKLADIIDCARQLYNAALQERRDAWNTQRKPLNYYNQASELKGLKQIPEITKLNCSVAENILRRLDNTFKAFFRRTKNGEQPGFPRFKGYNQFNSITFPVYGNGTSIKGNHLYIQNVGLVKIKIHRQLAGQIKIVILKRSCNNWYAIFYTAIGIEPLPISDKYVGIDLGIESFAVTSDNEFIDNPHYLKLSQTRLRVAQRKVARRKRVSNNRRKAVKLLARQHLRISNQRKDFAHKVARNIVNNYGFIAVEDLTIKNMVKNHSLAQSINDVGWGQFLNVLSYKAEWAGRKFVKVNPNGTSQICSVCGMNVPKDLSVRIHNCPNCGLSIHRDLNAALNILALGRSVWDVTCQSTECVSQEAAFAESSLCSITRRE